MHRLGAAEDIVATREVTRRMADILIYYVEVGALNKWCWDHSTTTRCKISRFCAWPTPHFV
jgi:hypothetical protein